MQTILLKEGFEDVFTADFITKVSQENEFIYLDSNELNISYNLDKGDMYGSPLGDDENDFFEIISELEKKFKNLTPFFMADFEIVYFTYNAEYSVSMWKFKDGILSNNADWIGEFCSSCDDIDDEDEEDDARNSFVDENYQSIKDGYPSDEILEGLRNGLYEL
jgi:hypothetical protein